ncbi:cell death regulator Aven-like [Dysidea avara]|uniref:cell death regulator Aven-like n=1 Tax=Dysidea avara TaxID=196820 RepID=UPI00332CC7F0
MGKGKKRDAKQRKTSNNEESPRSRQQANDGKATTPANPKNSDTTKTTGLSTQHNDGKFSKRKIISNWDRYSEDEVSSKVTEEKLVQRLTQLVEQTALQASQSSFQPSLDALQDVPGDDTVDVYSEVFDIDVEYLADSISKLPMHKRLDLDPIYFEDEGNYTHSTVIIEDKPPPVINRDIMLDTPTLLTAEKSSKNNKLNKQETILTLSKINTPPSVTNSVVEEDEMLTELLAAKTEDVGIAKNSSVKMTSYTVKSLPQIDAKDEENDSLLEELLAQPI